MKLKKEFIWKDLRVFALLAFSIAQWDNNNYVSRGIWLFLVVYFLIQQLYNHYIYYKATKKYY
jgi:hypothetical protein